MDQAVHPQANPILEMFGSMKKEQEGTFAALKQDDLIWKQLGESIFYDLLNNYVDNLIQKLDDLEGDAMARGASSDEIVMRLAVKRLTKVNLQSLITKIERTTEQLRGGNPSRATLS